MAVKKFSELKDRNQLSPAPALANAKLVAVAGTGDDAVNFNVPAPELIANAEEQVELANQAAEYAVEAYEGAVSAQEAASGFAQDARDEFRKGQSIIAVVPEEGSTEVEVTMQNYTWYSLDASVTSCTIKPAVVPEDEDADTYNRAAITTITINPSTTLEKGWLKGATGMTLSWPWNSEPEWDQTDSYIIEVAQTGPTTLAARPFNAPAGEKAPEWLRDPESDFVAWGYNAQGVYAPVAGRINKQIRGDYQFYRPSGARAIGADISAVFADSSFASETSAPYQFAYVIGGIHLPRATFENVTDASACFYGVTGDIHLPRATFAKTTATRDLFSGCGNVTANAFNPVDYANRTAEYGSGEKRFYSMNPKPSFPAWFHVNSPCSFYFPSLELDAMRTCSDYYSSPWACNGPVYAPKVNFQSLSGTVSLWYVHRPDLIETLIQIVYGPKVVEDDEGGWKAADTVYTDADGIVQMIDPADVQGERLLSNGNKKTGFGIQDFRVTDADTGEFVLDADGNYTYPWGDGDSPHTISLRMLQTDATRTEVEACKNELYSRGWNYKIII